MFTSLRKYCFTKLFKCYYLTQLRKVAGNKNNTKNIKDNPFFPWSLFSSYSGTRHRTEALPLQRPPGGAIAPRHKRPAAVPQNSAGKRAWIRYCFRLPQTFPYLRPKVGENPSQTVIAKASMHAYKKKKS